MEQEHRRLLKSKRDILSSIELEKLKPLLKEYKIFNSYMWKEITTTTEMFDALQYRGPKAFQNIIEILKKAKYDNEAGILENRSVVAKIDDSDLVYRMSSKCLGYCIIINNVNFVKPESVAEDDRLKDRLGSDIDAKSLENFFKSIEFDVWVERNKKASEMIAYLKVFSKKDFTVVDSLIVVILSHGGQEGNKDFIYGTDYDYIFKDKVWDIFSNEKCESLQNKPKIFFFICCRGEGMDYGVTKCLPKENIDSSRVIMPSFSDIFIVHSTLPEQVSVSDDDTGSFFCEAFIKVVNDCRTYDLETIIKVVNKKLQSRVSKMFRVIQAVHVESLAGTKKIMLCRTSNA